MPADDRRSTEVGNFLAPCVCSSHWNSPSPAHTAASLCFARELRHAEPPSNRSSVERNFMQICVSARPPAKLVAPPAMRHHAKTSATAITDLRFAVLSHDTLVLGSIHVVGAPGRAYCNERGSSRGRSRKNAWSARAGSCRRSARSTMHRRTVSKAFCR